MSYHPAKRSASETNGAELERGADMVTASVEVHHWTREEYERAVETGAFEGWKIELVEGVLVDMTPQGTPHSSAVRKLLRELSKIVPGKGLEVQPQMPLAVSEDSLPEPDIAVVPEEPGDYAGFNPSEAMLVAEVAQTSLWYDRNVKSRVYAAAGIPESWILNLAARELEVHREPLGGQYETRTVLTLSDEVSPLFAPEISIPVRRLFP
jgi:Uma2 family endonuclease